MFNHLKQGDRVRMCWNVVGRYPQASYVVASVDAAVITVIGDAGKAMEFDRATGKHKEFNEIWLEAIPEA